MKYIYIKFLFFCFCLIIFQSCKDTSTNSNQTSSNMTLVGKYDTPGYAEGIYIIQVGSTIAGLVADGSNGLLILNVSIAGYPTTISNLPTTGNALNITAGSVNGSSFAFVSCDNKGLYVIDISNLNTPAKDTIFTYSNDRVLCSFVDTQNKRLFVGTYNGNMYIYSLASLPSSVSLLGTYQTTGTIMSIQVANYLAYLALGTVDMEIVNVTNPAVPSFMNAFPANNLFFKDVKVSGQYAYIAGGDRLINLKIDSPLDSLKFISSYSNGTSAFYSVFASSFKVYCAEGSNGIELIDFATPSTPLQLGFYKTNDLALSLYYYNGNVFVADGGDGIIVLKYNQ